MEPTVSIVPWIRVQVSRYAYVCMHCGGIIPSNSWYRRYIIRHGTVAGKDPLSIQHVHLDCEAPWYQPEHTHLFRALSRLARRVPAAPAHGDDKTQTAQPSVVLPIAIEVSNPNIGTLLWKPPASLLAQLGAARDDRTRLSAIGEIERAFMLFARLILESAGSRKGAMVLSNATHQLATHVKYAGREETAKLWTKAHLERQTRRKAREAT